MESDPQDQASPAEQPEKRKGGPAYHNPACPCNPCTARRRAEEALALANGAGGSSVEADNSVAGQLVKTSDVGSPIARGHIANWVRIKTAEPELTNADIAKRLGIAPKTLNNHIYRARKEGWLSFEDPLEEVEFAIVPKTVRELGKLLDRGDKTAVIETAKGLVFKQYLESKGISQNPTNILAIKLEIPELGETQIVTGKIVGKPKSYVDAEILDAESPGSKTEAGSQE